MDYFELAKLLDEHDYRLVRVVDFKNCVRIHFEHKTRDLRGTWTTQKGIHLIHLTREGIEPIFPDLKKKETTQ